MPDSPTPVDALDILIIEDQHDLAANIWDYLERRGHRADHAADGSSGLALALHKRYDAIVLDLGLPRLDGLTLCGRLREAGHGTPVLMLTARDTLDDKLKGYAHGADDYMVKPFDLRELLARLQALCRRTAGSDALAYGPLRLDPASMLAWREGTRIALTRTQTALLRVLLQQAPGVVTHETLARAAWGDADCGSARLHDHLYGLHALVDKPYATALIHSVHGIGYRLLEQDACGHA